GAVELQFVEELSRLPSQLEQVDERGVTRELGSLGAAQPEIPGEPGRPRRETVEETGEGLGHRRVAQCAVLEGERRGHPREMLRMAELVVERVPVAPSARARDDEDDLVRHPN